VTLVSTGVRSGRPRRIEIVCCRYGDDVYLSGIPRTRDWLSDLAAEPHSGAT